MASIAMRSSTHGTHAIENENNAKLIRSAVVGIICLGERVSKHVGL